MPRESLRSSFLYLMVSSLVLAQDPSDTKEDRNVITSKNMSHLLHPYAGLPFNSLILFKKLGFFV